MDMTSLNNKLRSKSYETIGKDMEIGLFETDLDANELMNYHHTIVRMLFDRWQHCRQMTHLTRNIFNLSSMTETNNESFIHEFSTLISNITYLSSIIQGNSTMMVCSIRGRFRIKDLLFRLGNQYTID